MKPGLYDNISDVDYHADTTTLSSSGARTLLALSPAEFRYEQLHRRPDTKPFDVGHAAHSLVLGEGAPVYVLDPKIHGLKKDGTVAASPRATSTWQTAETEARERGETPVHIDDWHRIEAMADAVKRHKIAGRLFDGNDLYGIAEQSGYWTDPDTGVACRYRADWTQQRGDWLILVDLKTSDRPVSPESFRRSVYDYGYHMQDDWYRDGARMCHPDVDRISFLFVVVSKKPPHIVTVCELDTEAKQIAARRNREAREIFARCVATDEWPDYGIGPHLISLPKWATYREETAQ